MSAIKTDAAVMGGVPCFEGTRVPVGTFIDHIKLGFPIDYFLSQFPSVRKAQVEELLEDFRKHVGGASPRVTA